MHRMVIHHGVVRRLVAGARSCRPTKDDVLFLLVVEVFVLLLEVARELGAGVHRSRASCQNGLSLRLAVVRLLSLDTSERPRCGRALIAIDLDPVDTGRSYGASLTLLALLTLRRVLILRPRVRISLSFVALVLTASWCVLLVRLVRLMRMLAIVALGQRDVATGGLARGGIAHS
jgi:hypothetical protein